MTDPSIRRSLRLALQQPTAGAEAGGDMELDRKDRVRDNRSYRTYDLVQSRKTTEFACTTVSTCQPPSRAARAAPVTDPVPGVTMGHRQASPSSPGAATRPLDALNGVNLAPARSELHDA